MADTDSDADLLAHFQSLAPQPASQSSTPDSDAALEAHFAALAPQQATSTPAQWGASPDSTFATKLGREVAIPLEGIIGAGENLLGLPGDVGALENTLISKATGGRVKLPQVYPTSQNITTASTKLTGFPNNPHLQPQSLGERLSSGVAGGAATGLAIAATGGGDALPLVASGVTGNTAAELVHSVFPTSVWGPVTAGFLGGLGVGGVAGAMTKSAEVAQNAQNLVKSQAALKAAQDAAFEGKFATGQAADQIKTASAARLGSVKDLASATKTAAETDASNIFEQQAGQRGESTTYQQAGEVLQDRAQNWLDGPMQEQLEAARDQFLPKLPPTVTGDISNFEKAVGQNNSSAGSLNFLAKQFQPRTSGNLAKALEPEEESPESQLAELTSGEDTTPGQPSEHSMQDMMALRSSIGEQITAAKPVTDLPQQQLKNLYRGITLDMRVLADKAGVVPEFDQYNDTASGLYKIAEGPVTRVLGGKPGDIASSLVSGAKKDATDLATLRGIVPDGVDELGAAHLRQAGPGGWAKLGANPAAQEVLLPAADQRATLDAANEVRANATANANRTISEAADQHAAVVSAANQDLKTGNFARSKQVRDAADALAAAKLAAGPPGQAQAMNRLGNLLSLGESGAGYVLGQHIAPLLAGHLTNGGPAAATALELGGAALPFLYGGAKRIIQNQSDLRLPLTGAVAGSNPLALTPPPQK